MITNYRQLLSMWIVLSVVACTQTAAELIGEDRAAITSMGDRYLQALVDDDVTALASLFVENGVRLVRNGAVTSGRAEIQAIGSFAADFISFRTENVSIGGQGDLAYSWMDYDLTSVASEGAEAATFYGRFLMVLSKQPDGSWLVVAVMWNSRPSP